MTISATTSPTLTVCRKSPRHTWLVMWSQGDSSGFEAPHKWQVSLTREPEISRPQFQQSMLSRSEGMHISKKNKAKVVDENSNSR